MATQAHLRRQLADCDRRVDGYRKVLDEGGDPATVAGWIADTQRQRKALAARLGEADHGTHLTPAQVKQLVTGLRDIVTVLADAAPADKAALYKEMGLTMTYDLDGTVNVQVEPVGLRFVSEGGLEPPRP